MSCGQIALNRAGISYDNYYASEIDKYAIQVTQKNYPNTIQLGDITKINGSDLPKIDLLIGGSPCQGFSYAGGRLNFEDSRSKLFFEYVRLLKETSPKYFLLENVKMKKGHQDVISSYLGVEPIKINSNLVSAQNRVRLYWTNIPNLTQPQDKGFVLKDVIVPNLESLALDIKLEHEGDCLLFVPLDSHSSKSGLICLGGVVNAIKKMWVTDGKILQRNFSQGYRVHSEYGKATTLSTFGGGIGGKSGLYKIGDIIRKLTVVECERLQTVPDEYTEGVSDSQRHKMVGNGWTVDVIAHIFKNIGQEPINDLF